MSIAIRYHETLERIARAARRAGREPSEIQLVVVTKGHSVEAVRAVIAAGATHLGENYLEEAVPKMQALQDAAVTWHMIGHVQSRKARGVAQAGFSWLHSLDRLKLARRLNDALQDAAGAPLTVLLECNVSGETSKFGWAAWDERTWPALADELGDVLALPALRVRGLMTMAPYDDPAAAPETFQKLRRLRDYLVHHLPQASWEHLSMGMSGDFEAAIEAGATFVRIGTAIMGRRSTFGL
ncbi:MAG: YggS family pyridoxal phosphate-dependent enzyme [Anaerolineales bacterium]